MEKLNNCPVCNNDLDTKVFLKSKDFLLTKSEFEVVKCNNCTALITNPRPDIKEMPAYYNSGEYISHSGSDKSFTEKIYNRIKKIMIKKKMKFVKSFFEKDNLYILDFGCGTGDFLEHAKNAGCNVLGFENNIIARQKTLNKNITVLANEKLGRKIPDHFLDAITFWHSIEHVHDLYFLEGVINSLKPNGKIFIAIPEHLSFDAKVYKKYWAGYDLPRHLVHFNKQALSDCLSRLNCKLIDKKGLKYDSYYVSILSESYKKRPKLICYFNGFVMGTLSNLVAKISSKPYSSTIYVFEKNE